MPDDEKLGTKPRIDPAMIKSNEAVKKAKEDTSGRIYRVYCDGIFDMCHIGHMNMLKQAKNMLGKPEKTYLLVGVCSDELTHTFKGKTVMDHKTRCDTIGHLRSCDQVVPEAPWYLDDEFLNKYKIDFVAHDALPYGDASGVSDDDGDIYTPIKKKGMFMATKRTEGISTSDLIVNIIRDYDKFVERNLNRGYTKEELKVGRTWELRAKTHKNREQLQQSVDTTKQEWRQFKSMAAEFGRQFNPKKNKFKLDILRTNLKVPYSGVKKRTKTLWHSLWTSFKYALWYINPFAYFSRGSLTILFSIIFLSILWQYYLYTRVP